MTATMTAPAKKPQAQPETTIAVRYDVTLADIAVLGTKYAGLRFDTPPGYQQGSQALKELVKLRTTVEKRRVFLKADALAWGKKVDALAGELKASIKAIETPLAAAKLAEDERKAAARAAFEKAYTPASVTAQCDDAPNPDAEEPPAQAPAPAQAAPAMAQAPVAAAAPLAQIDVYCRNCNAVKAARHEHAGPAESELKCNYCNWIVVTFHQPVKLLPA